MKEIKKYIVFEIGYYYPSGGLFDMKGSYDKIEEIKEIGKEGWGDYKDIYIADRDTWRNIYKWSNDEKDFININYDE